MRIRKLPHTVHTMQTRHAQLKRYKRSVDLCSSGFIMAYPDDNSMTKMGRNVHVPVTCDTSTVLAQVFPFSFSFFTFLLPFLSPLSERRATARRMLSGDSHSQHDGWETPRQLFRCGLPGGWRSGEGSILVKHVQRRSRSASVRQRARRCRACSADTSGLRARRETLYWQQSELSPQAIRMAIQRPARGRRS